MNQKITFRDVIDALEKIHKFVSFGERVGKTIVALAKCGVDISRLNPMDFSSLMQVATALRSKGYDLEDIDIEELREEFEEIMDMELDEVAKSLGVINRFNALMKRASTTLRQASKSIPNPEAVSNIMAMFNLYPKKEKEIEEEVEEEETLDEETKRELQEAIRRYKKKKSSNFRT